MAEPSKPTHETPKQPRGGAAPPDAGGHAGSFTRPEDVEQVHAEQYADDTPPLSTDSSRSAQSRSGGWFGLLLVTLALLLLALALTGTCTA